ncbi:MAG: hypothetical protein J2P37_29875 [Ktedonobacteraceae bacterium]|nr:hypothetical protein [Ktedonobacteraceae bacterium]
MRISGTQTLTILAWKRLYWHIYGPVVRPSTDAEGYKASDCTMSWRHAGLLISEQSRLV